MADYNNNNNKMQNKENKNKKGFRKIFSEMVRQARSPKFPRINFSDRRSSTTSDDSLGSEYNTAPRRRSQSTSSARSFLYRRRQSSLSNKELEKIAMKYKKKSKSSSEIENSPEVEQRDSNENGLDIDELQLPKLNGNLAPSRHKMLCKSYSSDITTRSQNKYNELNIDKNDVRTIIQTETLRVIGTKKYVEELAPKWSKEICTCVRDCIRLKTGKFVKIIVNAMLGTVSEKPKDSAANFQIVSSIYPTDQFVVSVVQNEEIFISVWVLISP
uniref:Uncharacterized protein n=1 Tax=Clytia hemisphaerica TaxID=252671 RepID=A0A7M5UZ53_9CNID